MSDITLTARCHCSFASFTYTIPHSALPLKSSICHCNSCRYGSGQVFATFAVMPSNIPRPDFSHLKSYGSSPQLTRYSCPQCGAYVANTEPDEWEFATGILSATDGLLDRVQMWIEDTKDGGASIWLPKGHGSNPIRRLRDRNSAEATDSIIGEMVQRSQALRSPTPAPTPPWLEASCHCGTVRFCIRPPSPPDPPTKPPPYPAFLDACTSCRLTSGFELPSWIRIPTSHLCNPSPSPSPSDPYDVSPRNPNLAPYSSSPPVTRYACSNCTASAFYVNDSSRESVDVAMGLLRTEGGVRAEARGWVEWKRGPQFGGEALDRALVGVVEEGMRALREEDE